jgi:hypothetical protein
VRAARQKALTALDLSHSFVALEMNIERVILAVEKSNISMRDTLAMIRTAATPL